MSFSTKNAARRYSVPFWRRLSQSASLRLKETLSGSMTPTTSKPVALWLFGCSGLVFGMVILGGVTRLTRSGLSMTDWKFVGSRPPMSQQEWDEEFERYKQFPEFKRVNFEITLSEFKFIYMMEWSHRMFGRFIGVAFGLPFMFFAARRQIPSHLYGRLAGLFAMGGTQGFIGWWMVRSGLEEAESEHDRRYKEPRVSPYRLAVHLISAFAIYSLLLSTAIRAYPGGVNALLKTRPSSIHAPSIVKRGAYGLASLVGITAFSGAFVAGNGAGLVYNEWPLMGGRYVPSDAIDPNLVPFYRNFFEHTSLVQFEHRNLAYLTWTSSALFWLMCRRYGAFGMLSPAIQKASGLVFGMASVQVALGISTLLYYVPTSLAATHQGGSLALLSTAMLLLAAV